MKPWWKENSVIESYYFKTYDINDVIAMMCTLPLLLHLLYLQNITLSYKLGTSNHLQCISAIVATISLCYIFCILNRIWTFVVVSKEVWNVILLPSGSAIILFIWEADVLLVWRFWIIILKIIWRKSTIVSILFRGEKTHFSSVSFPTLQRFLLSQ